MSRPTLAVIQPYIFPYIGYFNLLKSCTNFVLYDDVNYIKRGWINRNRVLSSNGQINFSIPLSKQSSNLNINQIRVADLESFIKKNLIKLLINAIAKQGILVMGRNI